MRRHANRCSRRTARRKKGEKLCQRLPLENPSCLTHLCQLDTTKLACSASEYFFSLFHYHLHFLFLHFLLVFCFFLPPSNRSLCVFERGEIVNPRISLRVPHQLWSELMFACMCVVVELALVLSLKCHTLILTQEPLPLIPVPSSAG